MLKALDVVHFILAWFWLGLMCGGVLVGFAVRAYRVRSERLELEARFAEAERHDQESRAARFNRQRAAVPEFDEDEDDVNEATRPIARRYVSYR